MTFDDEQRGWLSGDDYQRAAEARDDLHRPTGAPFPPGLPGHHDECDLYRKFTAAVLELHQVVNDGHNRWCGCGATARMCPHRRLYRRISGQLLPDDRPGDYGPPHTPA